MLFDIVYSCLVVDYWIYIAQYLLRSRDWLLLINEPAFNRTSYWIWNSMQLVYINIYIYISPITHNGVFISHNSLLSIHFPLLSMEFLGYKYGIYYLVWHIDFSLFITKYAFPISQYRVKTSCYLLLSIQDFLLLILMIK